VTTGTAPAPPAVTQPQPERRRGFWSRLFGRRDRDEESEKEQERKEQTSPGSRSREE
jgi:hypothetical protein